MYLINRLQPSYSDIACGRLVAVNVFGEPFFERGDVVVKISPESGDEEVVGAARDFDFNALDDYWTAETLRAEWERQNGAVGADHFLVPITPFVLGGDFAVANLMKLPTDEAIALYRQIRAQVSGRPDGTKVSIEVELEKMDVE